MKKYEAPEVLTIELMAKAQVMAASPIREGEDDQDPATREWRGNSWDDEE